LAEEEDIPNAVTTDMRNEVVDKWKALYYTDLNSNQSILGAGGWWGDAEMFEVILDAYETGANPVYKEMFEKLYTNFIVRNGATWTNNDFNDDIAWMVIACTRAYLLFGEQTYLARATRNFDLMYERALLPSGMLRWKERDASLTNQTNSCINGPAEVAACYLAMATNDESYYEKAKALYALQRQYLYVSSTGQVYDCFTWVNNTPSNYSQWASTYNQGTFMGAALMLYAHYGNQQYRDDALKIMEYTKNNLCNANGIIKVCQVANGDLAGFKGILMRYVRRLITGLGSTEYAAWMKKNALHAYNNRNSAGITHSSWLSKTPESYISEPDPFGASTAVSAIVNAPIETPSAIEKIKTDEKSLNVSVYPNPATEYVYIDSPEDGRLYVYAAMGRLIESRPLKTGLTLLHITGYERGVYILKIKSGATEMSQRIIKQ
jgi:predicted alpha-1,6-mannanase (GH76 family)